MPGQKRIAAGIMGILMFFIMLFSAFYNKELMIIPGAVHTDLYDGGDKDYIPFDKLESFFNEYLK